MHAPPYTIELAIAHDRDVRARTERRCERGGNPSLEGIARELDQLRLDALEGLPLPLANLDVQQLEEVTIAVGRGCSGTFGAVEQTVGDVESNGACAERRASGGVGWPHRGGIDERGGMRGESSRVPRRVARVGGEQGEGREVSHGV